MKIQRVLLVCAAVLQFATASVASDFKEHRNIKLRYAVAYPSQWTEEYDGPFEGQNVFSIMSREQDANITIVTKPMSQEDRSLYSNIMEVPGMRDAIVASLKQVSPISALENGTTQVSNTPAMWLRYRSVNRSLDGEVWFAVYQVYFLRNGNIFTITAKVADPNQKKATEKFRSYWPTVSRSIASITFLP